MNLFRQESVACTVEWSDATWPKVPDKRYSWAMETEGNMDNKIPGHVMDLLEQRLVALQASR